MTELQIGRGRLEFGLTGGHGGQRCHKDQAPHLGRLMWGRLRQQADTDRWAEATRDGPPTDARSPEYRAPSPQHFIRERYKTSRWLQWPPRLSLSRREALAGGLPISPSGHGGIGRTLGYSASGMSWKLGGGDASASRGMSLASRPGRYTPD